MPAKPSVSAQLQMLRCHVQSNAYAFEAAKVRAIHRWESVSPASPDEQSIGTLEGQPVYPLARLLGLDEDAVAGSGPVLQLEGYAIQVDRVSRPALVPEADLRRLPKPALASHNRISGMVRVDGQLTLLLDPERLRCGQDAAAIPPWPADEPWRASTMLTTDKLLCFVPPGPGDQTYLAVSYRQAVEVAQGLTMNRLHSSEPWLAGLVDWRERAVPVVDVAGLLGLSSTPVVDVSRVLVVRSPRTGELFAFPASYVAPLPLPLGEDTMIRKTLDPPSPYIRAAYALEDGYLFLPDLEKLVQAAAEYAA